MSKGLNLQRGRGHIVAASRRARFIGITSLSCGADVVNRQKAVCQ